MRRFLSLLFLLAIILITLTLFLKNSINEQITTRALPLDDSGGYGQDTSCSITITTTLLPSSTVNALYSQQLSATGNDYVYDNPCKPYNWYLASGSLPSGLTLSTNGLISGTPTTAGTYNFAVNVFDQSTQWSTSKQFSLTINPGAIICNDECILNTRICSAYGPAYGSAYGYQICGNYDSDSCTEYSTITPCTQNQVCSNGVCSGSGITLDKCSDNTNYNQCSTSQPRYCDNGVLVNDCALCGCPNNGECLTDGSCRAIVQGVESTNLKLINNPPTTSFIPETSLSESETKTNNLIDLNNYVSDPESQQITFTFANKQPNFNSDVIDCHLLGSIINCDPPKKPGTVDINIVASDGNKSSQSEFKINIIPSFVRDGVPRDDTRNYTRDEVSDRKPEQKIKQRLNIAPIADAGSDKTAFFGSIVMLDGSKSYDLDNNLPNSPDNYIWLEDNRELGRGIKLKMIPSPGTHRITLKVIDSYGAVSTDELIVNVKSKTNCLKTKTLYNPPDTICNNKWPSTEGELIKINSVDYSCNLVEVCDENLDHIIEDSINCCDGTPLIEPRKSGSCSFANKYSQSNAKRCQGLYLIKSLGADAIYMQDYFEAEMCCRGVTELCNSYINLYSAKPVPSTETTNILSNNLRCLNTPNDNPPGKWLSDTKIDKNNIALSDVPAHVSLDILSTGTCVDYSFSLTTLLRKAGYLQNEVYTVEAPNHAYNLVKLPLDKKYTIVDTTGNNEPSILLGKTPLFYGYCENIDRCYNDNGEVICPSLKNIYGCENVKESLVKETKVASYKAERIISNIVNLFKEEIKR